MEETRRDKLWSAYAKKRDPETREALIMEYVPLVKVVSGRPRLPTLLLSMNSWIRESR